MSHATYEVLCFLGMLVGGLFLLWLVIIGIPMLIMYLTRESHRKEMDALEEMQRYRIAEQQRWREEANALAREPFDPLRQSELYDQR